MKVLYPTDGSQTAKAALEFAVDIAKAQEGSILVLSVAEKVGAPTGEWEDMEKTLLDFAKDFSEQAVKEIKKRGVEAEARVEIGKPAEVIVNVAKDVGADAIVMGTHGWTGLARAVIGSVADRVIRHATCPVVLVPTKIED
jgi:nucleotide-binding universal stress UspA family protein